MSHDEEQECFDEEDAEARDQAGMDCGMITGRLGRPEGCTKAGSEECDFECPFRDELYRALRPAKAKS